jgi:hypothetical protein
MDILRSRKIIQKVLLSNLDSTNKRANATLIDYFLDYKGWKKKWSSKSNLKNLSYANLHDNDNLSLIQDSILNLAHQYILKNSFYADRLNKKGTIIKVRITENDQVFAKLMTDRLVDEAGKLYLDIKTGTATANIRTMQRRSDSLLALLNSKSYTVAASQLLDFNPGFKTAAVPTEIASRDKTIITTLYAEVTRNLEASKLILSQQTPIIQILDRPTFPLVDKQKGLIFCLIVSTFITSILVVTALGIRFLIMVAKKS